MIYGIGTDIVEIQRIRNAVERWGEFFLKKLFTEKEVMHCYKRKDPYPHLAVRFAAKEAVIKAISPAVRSQESGLSSQNAEDMPVKISNLKHIEIVNHPTGKPFINLLGNLKLSLSDDFVIHLTLTHERNYAVATVVVETKPE